MTPSRGRLRRRSGRRRDASRLLRGKAPRLRPCRSSPVDGVEEDVGDLARLLVEREMAGAGDRGDGDGGTLLEHGAFVVGEPDVVALPEHDPRANARATEARGERAVA